MQTIQCYAEWNRQIIVREILKRMKWKAVEQFSVAHNYIDHSGEYERLDEAPFSYRSITEIAEQVKDTVEITEPLKPVYNFKAGNRKQGDRGENHTYPDRTCITMYRREKPIPE